MKFSRILLPLLTALLLHAGLLAQTTVLSLTSSGTNAATQTWANTYCQPVTVRITVKGGGGGGGMSVIDDFINIEKGSTGATMVGEFTVPAGYVLRAIAGGAGESGLVPLNEYLNFAGGGGGAGSGVVNATTNTLLILAAGGTGAHGYRPGIGASAATDGNGSGGSAGTWSTGGGGLNGAGGSDNENGCPVPGGGQVSLTSVSLGANNCYYYSYAGDGGSGMGGGGGASDLGGGGGGHTGGGGGNARSAAKSYNTGTNQVNTNGADDADPNAGTVLIQVLTDVSGIPPDVTLPTVTCKNHTVILSAANTASIVPTDVHQSSSDACGPVTLVSVSPNSFNCTHVGPNTVTLTVRDPSNNTATCTATVTVQDNVWPQVSCKQFNINLNQSNTASIVPANVFQSGSDNCGTVTPISVSPNTFDCSDVGPNTIFLLASDGNGNSAACSSTVVVYDATLPTVTCKNHTVYLSATGTATVAPDDVFQSGTDNCGTVRPISVSPSTLTCANIGQTTVTLTANDGTGPGRGNTATCTATVTVRDDTPPLVSCKSITLDLNASGTATISPASVLQASSDNCGTVTPTSVMPNSFGCGDTGPNTVTLSVTDGHGHSASCTAQVVVADRVRPQVSCKNITVILDENNSASIEPADVTQSLTDNCGTISSISVSPENFDCGDVGQNTVYLFVADLAGNLNNCDATVTVRDAAPPTVTCKNHTVYLSAAGMVSVAPADVFQSGTDNCGTVNPSSVTPNSFGCGNAGANTVTLRATDGSGNEATCTATVTVFDNTPPQVVCKNYTANLDQNGIATVAPADVFQSGSDNCGTVNLVSVSPNSFTCSHIGPNTVTLNVNDASGNLSECLSSVTVQDIINPSVTCKNHTVFLSSTGTASIAPADVFQSGSDNCGTVNLVSVSPNSFTCSHIGPNTVTLNVNDGHGNTATCTATVTVSDNTPPQVFCKNHTVALDQNGSASAVPAHVFQSGSDNCGTVNLVSISPNSFDCTQVGPVTITLTVNDGNSNTASCTASVTVQDNIPPSIVCPQNIARNTDPNQCTAVVAYASPTVTDNCTNWTLTRTSGLASTSAFPIGANMVHWKVTDPGGNTALCQFTVTITDAQAPTLACPQPIVRGTDAGQCSAAVNYTTPTATDNCGVASVTLETPSGTSSGSMFPKGTTVVVWKATDTATPTANTATCSFTITVNDNQLPSITCPSNIVRGTDAGQCQAAVTYTAPTASDNCAGVTATLHSPANAGSGSVFPKGQTVVTWKATDAAGLTKTCTFRVTVNDTENPVVTCPTVAPTTTTVNSCASEPLTYPTPTASDNCSAVTVLRIGGPASGSSFPAGTTNVTWRAIDGAGRSSTCSFAVTVTDAAPPSISCPGSQTVTGSGSPCMAMVTYATPTASDNCGVQSVFLLSGQPSGSSFPAGTTSVVWRATDVNAGSATCGFAVTVSCGTTPSGSPNGGVVASNLSTGTSNSELLPVGDIAKAGQILDLKIVPNPAVERIRIFTPNMGDAAGELTVYDAQGRLIWRQRVGSETLTSETTIDLDDRWQSGMYFVTLRSEGQTVTKRLVVSKL
jgi:hypothetical protein